MLLLGLPCAAFGAAKSIVLKLKCESGAGYMWNMIKKQWIKVLL